MDGTAGIGGDANIPKESVVVCDITSEDGLDDLMKDCDALMICTSAKPGKSAVVLF